MARVKAIAVGYYNHRRVKVGEIFKMSGVNDKGFYLDDKGAIVRDRNDKPKKCLWVDHVSTEADKPADPKEIAAVISGRNPGKPIEFEENDEKPAKAK